jgi:hypothetical protein
VPDFTGMSARGAFVAARRLNLWVKLEGTGKTVWQEPEADKIVARGTEIQVVLQPSEIRPSRGGWNVLAAQGDTKQVGEGREGGGP